MKSEKGMKKSLSIHVYGKVQGVGFRFYTNKKANELGVNGFVKNMRDGSVRIEAEAEDVVMEEFLSWVKHGPEWARVSKVNVQDVPAQDHIGFTIR